MEEASGRRHQGEGIREEASLGRHRGGGIVEEASWRNIMEEGGIMEEHPGGIWETSGRHPP